MGADLQGVLLARGADLPSTCCLHACPPASCCPCFAAASDLDEYENEDDPGYQRMDVVGQEAALGRELLKRDRAHHPIPSVPCALLRLLAPHSCLGCLELLRLLHWLLFRLLSCPGWVVPPSEIIRPLRDCSFHYPVLHAPHMFCMFCSPSPPSQTPLPQWSWTK